MATRIGLETAQGHFREAAGIAERWADLDDNASDDVTRYAAAIHAGIALYEAGDTPAADAVTLKYLSARASGLPNTTFHTGIAILGFRYYMGTIDRATFRRKRAEAFGHTDTGWLEDSPHDWYTAYAQPVVTSEDAREALAAMPSALRARTERALTMDAMSDLEEIAHAYWVAGDVERTMQYAKIVTNACIALYSPESWIRAHLELGAAFESVGKKDDACQAYGTITDRWGKTEYSRTAEDARLGSKRTCGQQPGARRR